MRMAELTHSELTLDHLKEAQVTFEMELPCIASHRCMQSDAEMPHSILR